MLERRIAETFVDLADTLVVGFDVIDLLHTLTERCVELLPVDAAGILLADQRGSLSVVAASTEQARLLELFQLQDREGPCLEAYHSGRPVEVADLSAQPQRWPRFTIAARQQGFAAMTAMPLRLRTQVLGAINLFRREEGSLPDEQRALAQAFADVATISIMHERALHQRGVVAEQLQHALNSRVVIEQAKGALAVRGQIPVSDAFALLRNYARSHSRELSGVARDVLAGNPAVADLIEGHAPPLR